jgi:hypothetical protein
MTRPTPKPPSDLSIALSAARDAVGDAAALQRVRAGVLSKIATGAAPPAAVSVAGAWLGKSLAALLLTAGAGAAVYSYSYNTDLPPAAASPAAPPRDADPPQTAAASAQRDADPPQTAAASAQRDANPLASAQPVRIEEPLAAKPTHATPRAKAAAKRSTTPQLAAALPKAPCSDAVAEVALVSRAQQALRSQPQLALSLLTEHAQRFSCGVLALERDSLRIDAERALGLQTQAAEHARELVARYPEAPETRALKNRLDPAANSGSDHKTQPEGTPTP